MAQRHDKDVSLRLQPSTALQRIRLLALAIGTCLALVLVQSAKADAGLELDQTSDTVLESPDDGVESLGGAFSIETLESTAQSPTGSSTTESTTPLLEQESLIETVEAISEPVSQTLEAPETVRGPSESTSEPVVEATSVPGVETLVLATEPVVESLDSTTGAVTETVEPITDPVPETVAPGGPVAETVQPVMEPVLANVEPVTDPVLQSVEPVIDPVLETVEPIVDPVLQTVEPVIDPVLQTVEPVIDPVLQTVEPVIDPVLQTVEPVIDPVLQTVEPVIDPVLQTVEPVTDPVLQPVEPVVAPVLHSIEPATGPARETVEAISVPSLETIELATTASPSVSDSSAAEPALAAERAGQPAVGEDLPLTGYLESQVLASEAPASVPTSPFTGTGEEGGIMGISFSLSPIEIGVDSVKRGAFVFEPVATGPVSLQASPSTWTGPDYLKEQDSASTTKTSSLAYTSRSSSSGSAFSSGDHFAVIVLAALASLALCQSWRRLAELLRFDTHSYIVLQPPR